jgi:hypothetical protein
VEKLHGNERRNGIAVQSNYGKEETTRRFLVQARRLPFVLGFFVINWIARESDKEKFGDEENYTQFYVELRR